MMNTLASYEFLNRDGKNLTRDVVVNGLSTGLNFNTTLAIIMLTEVLQSVSDPQLAQFCTRSNTHHFHISTY